MLKKTLGLVFFLSLFLLTPYSLLAQTKLIDSLQAALSHEKNDTNKVRTLTLLSDKMFKAGQLEKAFENGVDALELASKLNYVRGEANAFKNIGSVYYAKLKYADALNNYTLGYKAEEALKDTFWMAYFATRRGLVYFRLANYPKALDEDFLSLKLRESVKDSVGMASSYINLGNVNSEQGNFTDALKYEQKALELSQRTKHKMNESSCLNNIGGIYVNMKRYPEAIESFRKVLTMSYALQDDEGIAIAEANIGETFHDLKREDSALVYFVKALDLKKKINYSRGIESSYIDMAVEFNTLKQYYKARMYADSALRITLKSGSENYISEAYTELSHADSNLGNFKLAFEEYIHGIAWRDSMVNDENTKKSVQAEMNYEFDKKQTLEKLEQDKKDELQEEAQHKQRITIYFISGILALVLFFAVFIFMALQANRKKTIIISKQKEEVEKQKTVVEQQKTLVEQQKQIAEEQKARVEEQNVLIEHQKEIVEEKNKDITDSIKYASRIQRALLTTDEYISQQLNDYFILFKPRDIVSGDFYWAFNGYGVFYMACCDCTGHGVPGAFMSLLNISMLNETVIERKIIRPDRILNDVRDNIIKSLNPEKSDSESQDGMDCSICAIDLKNMSMQAACANNPVWVIKNHTAPPPPKGGISESYGYEMADPILYGKLKEFVKEHRSNPTQAEIAFWELVRGKRLDGFKFRRQHIINEYIVDFVCLPYKLVIEIDGLIHQLPENKESDRIRTDYLSKKGFKVLRFTNEEVIANPDSVCAQVLDMLNAYKGEVVDDLLQTTENPPLEGREALFVEILPDKMPVGIQYGEQKPFTIQNVKLTKGDCVYMFTDGYADQFGGPKGKKFKYKALQELVLANSHKPMAEQRHILETTLEQWRGNLEQVDDILMIGIRV